jgi:hypothetical protein
LRLFIRLDGSVAGNSSAATGESDVTQQHR